MSKEINVFATDRNSSTLAAVHTRTSATQGLRGSTEVRKGSFSTGVQVCLRQRPIFAMHHSFCACASEGCGNFVQGVNNFGLKSFMKEDSKLFN
jgi:hypothetical protein